MPAVRITIALNSNQAQKAPLLLPATATSDPDSVSSYKALVLKAAQAKLRLKKGKRLFIARTGKELVTEADWTNELRNDVVLLVSAGEEYVGLMKEDDATHAHTNSACPTVVLAHGTPIDNLAFSQLETTARTLPGLIHAVGQPDLHPGTKFPIGAVFVSKQWIHPPLIGGDIGCGMAWYKTKLSRSQLEGDRGRKIAEKLRGLEGPWRTKEEREKWLNQGGSCWTAGEEWDKLLGTIGAGNHFAEIQVVEKVTGRDKHVSSSLNEDEVVLLVHSGSRGYGGDVLKRYTAEGDNTSLHEDDQKAKAYMEEHRTGCEWATANRDLIALRFLACLEPGEASWEVGLNKGQLGDIKSAKAKLRERKVVDIWHNNVERILWPPRPPPAPTTTDDSLVATTASLSLDMPQQTHAYIHRKGAAPTYDPYTSMPLSILPLPGSRGTPTLILHPTFSSVTSWGAKNALSLAHGAGRSMSRAKALASLSQKYKNTAVLLEPGPASQQAKSDEDGREVRGGTWVVCEQKELVWEEAPEAYKDVWAVGDDLAREGVAEIVGWCRARVSYKNARLNRPLLFGRRGGRGGGDSAQTTGKLGDAPVILTNPVGSEYIANLPNNPNNAIRGSVVAISAPSGRGVRIAVTLSGLPASGGPFMYHIHDQPVPANGNCTATLAHLDPYQRGEDPPCDASAPQTCQVGDLSGKHGAINGDSFAANYVDDYISLIPGQGSFFGNRSIVVHYANKTRIACANFVSAASLANNSTSASASASGSSAGGGAGAVASASGSGSAAATRVVTSTAGASGSAGSSAATASGSGSAGGASATTTRAASSPASSTPAAATGGAAAAWMSTGALVLAVAAAMV